MSDSNLIDILGVASGYGFYSYGTRLIIAYPQTSFSWAFYTSPIAVATPTRPNFGPDNALATTLNDAGIPFNEVSYGVAPGSIQGVKGTRDVNKFNGAQGVQAEAARIKANFGNSIFGQVLTKNASPGMRNTLDNARNMDLFYQTRSFLTGATNNYVEVKSGFTEFYGRKGGRARIQALSDVKNLHTLNANVAGIRTLGQGLRIGGTAFGVGSVLFDAYSTYGQIKQQLGAVDPNPVGAGRSGVQFLGRQGVGFGGLLAGAYLFGESGFLAGSIDPGLGNVIGGTIGAIGGGIAGAVLGEAGVTAAYNSIFGGTSNSPLAAGDQASPEINPLDPYVSPNSGGLWFVPPDKDALTQVPDQSGNTTTDPQNDGGSDGYEGLPQWQGPNLGTIPGSSLMPNIPLDLTPPSNNVTITPLPDYFDAYGNGYSSQGAADAGQDAIQDSGDYGGGDAGGGGDGSPVVLDLTGGGIKITQLTSSHTFFDMTGNGTQNLTAWAGAGNGVLFYDPTGQGQLTQADQINFVDWDPSATSDIHALEDVFDTNHDGNLDAGDADFSDFFVMETNANGTETAYSLASLGITAINLTANATNIALPDGSSIDGETTYTTASGTAGTAATVTFAYDSNGYAVTTTTAENADGSTTIDNAAENSDGSVEGQNILNTFISTATINGVRTTTTTQTLTDLNNGGVVATLQTDNIVATSGGTTTETLTNYSGGTISSTGELTSNGIAGSEKLNSTTTITAAISGGTQVTILRDQLGGGWTTQKEVDTAYTNGSSSEVISDLNPDGSASVITTTVTNVTSGGSTTTVTSEVDGIDADSTTSVDAISGAAPSTETETITDSVGTTVTSMITTVTQTDASSNSVTRTTKSDLTDGSTLDLTSVTQTVTNANGSTTITQTDTSANNTLLDKTVTTETPQSAGGLVTQVISSELDGGAFVNVGSQTTTISNAGATSTRTIVNDSTNGTLLSESIATTTLGSAAATTIIYGNGDGEVSQSEIVTVNGGTTTGTQEDLNGDGSLVDEAVTVTSNGGLSKTTYIDATGAGTASSPIYDHETTDVTTTAGGVSTEIVTDYGASTSDETSQTKTVVSANGLTTTVYSDFTGTNFVADGNCDQISTDQTAVNSDGSLTETFTVTDGYGNILETTTKETSTDRKTATTTTTLGTTGLATTVKASTTEANGTTVDTVINKDYNGDVVGASVKTTSADGLVTITQDDIQGQTAAAYAASGLSFDLTTTDTTTINPDGSQTETSNVTSKNGTLLSTDTIVTSATGLSTTTTDDPYATVDYSTQTTDITTLNADGSKTEIVSVYNYNQSLIDLTTTTTSASSLSTTILNDFNGDGIIDQSSTDDITINADGSQTEVVTDYTGGPNGTVRDVTTTTSGLIVAGEGLETIITKQSDGSVPVYQVETIMPSANGTVTDTTQYYAQAGGPLLWMTATTTSANGLTQVSGTAVNGDTSIDYWASDSTVLNANGSETETVANYNKSGLINERVTTSTPNGLSSATEVDANGALNSSGTPIFNLVTTDNTVLNSDGSRTETITSRNADGGTIGQTVKTTAADQQTITTQRYLDETGNVATVDQTETSQTHTDGSTVETISSYDTSHAFLGTIVTTTSGNHLSTGTTYYNSQGTVVDTESDNTTYDSNGDGGTTEAFENVDIVDGADFTTSRITQSTGNDQTKTITIALAGALSSSATFDYSNTESNFNVPTTFNVVATDSIAVANNDVTTETIADTLSTSTIVTSANNLDQTTSTTLAGSRSPYIVEQKSVSLDGSESDITTYYNPGSLSLVEEQMTVNKSWDGRTIQTSVKSDYDGTKYNYETETYVENANNSTTESLSFTGSFGAPATEKTVSVVTNSDSSQTTTTINYDAEGNFIEQTVDTVSPDGLVKYFSYSTGGQAS